MLVRIALFLLLSVSLLAQDGPLRAAAEPRGAGAQRHGRASSRRE